MMPDPIVILSAMAIAFAVSDVVVGGFGWPRRTRSAAWVNTSWVLGVAAGFFLGCWMLGNRPHWPPRDDLDRLFILVLPAVVLVELLAALERVPRWLVNALRAVVIIGTAPVLLFGTSYLSDQNGTGEAEWSKGQACLILGGLAAAVAVVWFLLGRLNSKAPGVIHTVCLAGTSAGAAICVMLSGYASGGQNGLTLAAALLGAASITAAGDWSARGERSLGVSIILLYALLIVGRFFGELSSTHGILLLASPLLGWLPELPGSRRLPTWGRNLCRLVLVGILVSGVVIDTARILGEASSASEADEPAASEQPNFER
jgi:hypothetical protein